MKFVYSTWIYLWSSTFEFCDPKEQRFRVNQLIRVLLKLKEPMQNGQDVHPRELINQVIQSTFKSSTHEISEMIYTQYKNIFPGEQDQEAEDKINIQKKFEKEAPDSAVPKQESAPSLQEFRNMYHHMLQGGQKKNDIQIEIIYKAIYGCLEV